MTDPLIRKRTPAEVLAYVAAKLREQPDATALLAHSLTLDTLADELTPKRWCDCCSAGNHTTRCDGSCGIECCHPLYHTDWERAEREHIAEVRARMALLDGAESESVDA